MEKRRRAIQLSEPSHAIRHVHWTMGADEEGEPMTELAEFGSKTFQVTGEFAGATVEILGSILMGEEFDRVSDYDTIPLTFSMRGIKSTEERVYAIMPRVVGGDPNLTRLRIGAIISRKE